MERTDQPAGQPSPTLAPQPNRILATPDTVEACQQEYAAGADVRQTLATQEARTRR
jgi:hypothetical protein